MNTPQIPAQADGMVSILVIDDHPLYCDALVTTLERLYDQRDIRTATSLKDGLAMLGSRFAPGLVLLDLKLPDVTGLSGFVQIREELPDVPIILISSESSNDLIHTVMSMGAAGFISKNASQSELSAALERVQQGERFVPDGYSKPQSSPNPDFDKQDVARKIADLTPQQARIMRLICDGKPNKQIAYEMSLAEATVKAHVTALLRRLGVRNRTQAAILARDISFDSDTIGNVRDLIS